MLFALLMMTFPVGLIRGCFLQHLQVTNENPLELGSIWETLRLTEFVNDHVRVGQCLNGRFGNLVGGGQ